MKNSDVAAAWYYGKEAESGTIRSDGRAIFSYAMKIGEINDRGDRICFDRRIAGCSKTTSRHIALVSLVANKTVNPDDDNPMDYRYR